MSSTKVRKKRSKSDPDGNGGPTERKGTEAKTGASYQQKVRTIKPSNVIGSRNVVSRYANLT